MRAHQTEPIRVIWLVGVERRGEQMVEVAPAVAMVLVGPFGPGEMLAHVRDSDTIEVAGVPVRIANLDCAEMDTD